jgi:hypothetical protein
VVHSSLLLHQEKKEEEKIRKRKLVCIPVIHSKYEFAKTRKGKFAMKPLRSTEKNETWTKEPEVSSEIKAEIQGEKVQIKPAKANPEIPEEKVRDLITKSHNQMKTQIAFKMQNELTNKTIYQEENKAILVGESHFLILYLISLFLIVKTKNPISPGIVKLESQVNPQLDPIMSMSELCTSCNYNSNRKRFRNSGRKEGRETIHKIS